MGLILTMGGISLGGAMISKVLNQTGRSTEAQLVDMASLGMLGVTAVGCILELLNQLKKL